ncbi:MAG: AAA family ATPase [Pseudomonadota bacterium]
MTASAPTRDFHVKLVEGAGPARLALDDFLALGLSPGDCIQVGDAAQFAALPAAGLEQGFLCLPRQDAQGLIDGALQPVQAAPEAHTQASQIRFADVGGVSTALGRLREMVELPLLRPDVFDHLGIAPPRGVLMYGPPGCGKTLIARALAEETKAAFFQIAGPEIADKHFGASEGRLREIFEAARAAAPAIIFIDEIDSIAPARSGLSSEKQAERRMVAQLLTLMDGLDARGDVVVLAATNLPDLLDPALRRPGRFDREIALSPPDVIGREEILRIHTRSMPLDATVSLSALAQRSHGFVGADLASLAREAGLAALRRSPSVALSELSVSMADFDAALTQVRPSALRAYQVEVPRVTWDDIAGAQAAKDALRQAIEWPARYKAHYAYLQLAPPSGVLLHGPPGTGKTLLARALATAADANFINVSPSMLLSMFLGESERALSQLFAQARANAPCVLFFDELDAIAPSRAPGLSETASRIVGQFLTELDGLADRPGLFVLGATNRLSAIDPAIVRPGRFDLKIAVDLPERDDREALFAHYFAGAPSEALDFAALAAETEGASGADIAELARRARHNALMRTLQSKHAAAPEDIVILPSDVRGALDE